MARHLSIVWRPRRDVAVQSNESCAPPSAVTSRSRATARLHIASREVDPALPVGDRSCQVERAASLGSPSG